MQTAIIYCSQHHGNTKKLLDAIAQEGGVDLIEASASPEVDLAAYDLIGFASGIYYSKLHSTVTACAARNLPRGKKIFVVYTYGLWKPDLRELEQIAREKGAPLPKTSPGLWPSTGSLGKAVAGSQLRYHKGKLSRVTAKWKTRNTKLAMVMGRTRLASPAKKKAAGGRITKE